MINKIINIDSIFSRKLEEEGNQVRLRSLLIEGKSIPRYKTNEYDIFPEAWAKQRIITA